MRGLPLTSDSCVSYEHVIILLNMGSPMKPKYLIQYGYNMTYTGIQEILKKLKIQYGIDGLTQNYFILNQNTYTYMHIHILHKCITYVKRH